MAEKSPSLDFEIIQHCEIHKKSYEWYCRKHEAPCCTNCKLDDHKNCKKIFPLADVVRKTNLCSYVTEVELQLDNLFGNLKTIQEENKSRSKKLNEQRIKIEDKISMLRQKINDHLDKVQAKIVNELSETEANINKTTKELLTSLKEKERDVMKMKQNIMKLKQNGSDLQIFVYVKQAETSAVQNEYFLELLKEQGELDQVELTFHVNSSINAFLEKLQSFGNISVKTTKSSVVMEIVSGTQAQKHVNRSPENIGSITMELIRKIQHGFNVVLGCCILSNGTTIFSDCKHDKIIAVNEEGGIDFEIKTKYPCDITSIDKNTIAVATHTGISIIDIGQRIVARKIKVDGRIGGLTYKEGTVICCVRGKGIRSISLEDESVTSIVKCDLPDFSYVTTYGDNIYYTGVEGSKTVTCCDIKGNMQWKFGDDNVLREARGITVDENGFIYIGSTQNKISFYARLLTDRNLAPSQIVIFDDVVTNNGGGYNRYTGHFIAPCDGTYYFASSFLCEGDGLHVQLMKNGEDIGRGVAVPIHASAGSINAIVNLKHGDVVRIRHATWVGTEKMRGSTYSAFTGYLL